MIFVPVGTHEQPFNRLIKKIDELKESGIIQEDVIIQTGFSTYEPKHCQWSKLIPYQQMLRNVADARIVITHGGPASFIMPLQIGKTPIVVPRQHQFNEHVNDHQVDLFEGQYVVPNGMSYNSYVIMDEKIAVMDTVDANFKDEWLENVARVLDGAKPDYLVVQHMEPDHAANIENFMKAYPDTTVVANTKTFTMMGNFFRNLNLDGKKLVVANGDSLTLGKHVLTFVFAPMVHWPEVMVTYDSTDKVLFSADGFGKFGALDVEEDWDGEARRYYIGIVGKYGAQVQKLLKAAATLDIQTLSLIHI